MPFSRLQSAAALTTLTFILCYAPDGHRAATPPGPYALTDLGTLGGLSALAFHLNETGQVVGYATTSASQARAFVWQGGSMTNLGTLGGSSSFAHGINDVGQIVGESRVSGTSQSHAAFWNNGTITDLTPGVEPSTANAINNAGQIVGTRNHATAFLWQGGVTTDLPDLGGGAGAGNDINNDGQAVGSSYTGLAPHAVLWENGTATDLGVLPGKEDSGASAINDVGQIVGSSGTTDPETYEVTSSSFIYENGQMTALPVPSTENYASDINDAGVVVGSMRGTGGFSKYHAYIFADGVVTNLNSLIPSGSGLHLAFAYAINNDGQIAGVAVDAQYRNHAFLLTPLAAGTATVSIGDASVTEGDTATRTATLTLTLSATSGSPVTVTYTTADGSATAGDYQPASGTATFAAGQTSTTIAVLVNGDRTGEANETFVVNLSQASSGAMIADGQGAVTIADDEPRLSVNDVSKNEGHSGTTPFVFTVRLSAASTVAINAAFATSDGSARAAEDYDALSGVVTFNPGEITKTVTVNVKGDRKAEGTELFGLHLSSATGAFLADGQGSGSIKNDDR